MEADFGAARTPCLTFSLPILYLLHLFSISKTIAQTDECHDTTLVCEISVGSTETTSSAAGSTSAGV